MTTDGDRSEPHDSSPHPGETVRFECIQAAGLTITEAARRLGCYWPAMSRVLNGRAAVSPNMALAFEGKGWTDADFWMYRQAAYDLWRGRAAGRSRPSAALSPHLFAGLVWS